MLPKLIQSMNRSEQRHFMLTSSQTGENKDYLWLYDMYRQDPDIGDKTLLKDKRVEDSRKLSVMKFYLKKRLLKVLDEHQEQVLRNPSLDTEFRYATLMMQRNLGDSANKALLAVKKKSEVNDDFIVRYKVLNEERRILTQNPLAVDEDAVEALFEEQLKAADQLRNLIEYQRLWSKVSRFMHQRLMVRTEEDRQFVEEVLQHPLIQTNQTLSTRARNYRDSIMSDCYQFLDQNDLAFEIDKAAAYAALERKSSIKPSSLIGILNNALFRAARASKFDEMPPLLHELQNVRSNSPKLKLMIEERYLQHLLIYHQFGEVDTDAEELVRKVESFLSEYAESIGAVRRVLLLYHVSTYLIYEEDYRSGLTWLLRTLSDPGIRNLEDIGSYARIAVVVCHFELNNLSQLFSAVRSTYRFLYRRKQLYGFERLVIRFFRRMDRLVNKREINLALKSMLDELEILAQDPLERNALLYFDIRVWINKRLAAG